MTQLSEHFSLAELTVSENARRLGLSNTPPPDILKRLTTTAEHMERVRALLLGQAIHVSSAYRSPAVNRAAGGAKASAHMSGWAVDFTCPDFGPPLLVARRIALSGLAFDQLIHEFGRWVHISFDPDNRGQVLTIDAQGTRPGLLPVRP
ncbi:D-Ala-D-Ala carboxypeptidase family metallohydrolase [Caulobacter sp. UNC279MFTsu5.1]|uniref:D-Ala-D-Ala carboxypeptidase family metallohydrolase n=1 Tax=Caulobacter sp. UNC279MFTsu5.1 TaxID=1502775 RepID=UPI0008F17A5C|nr:D-Ala-D-Ala carboxypeptidase family metallohydrolase [Caulobacter sp. UNC279MFTsu5.1]SFK41256.1 Peptidase M15 [Caulobacter sp. UNC279MFTsu5.1]